MEVFWFIGALEGSVTNAVTREGVIGDGGDFKEGFFVDRHGDEEGKRGMRKDKREQVEGVMFGVSHKEWLER